MMTVAHTLKVTTFQQHIHTFLIKSTKKPFSRRSSATEDKKLKTSRTCKEKLKCETRMKKMTWRWWESLLSGDPVAVKQLANHAHAGRKSTKQCSPLPPMRDQNQNLAEKS